LPSQGAKGSIFRAPLNLLFCAMSCNSAEQARKARTELSIANFSAMCVHKLECPDASSEAVAKMAGLHKFNNMAVAVARADARALMPVKELLDPKWLDATKALEALKADSVLCDLLRQAAVTVRDDKSSGKLQEKLSTLMAGGLAQSHRRFHAIEAAMDSQHSSNQVQLAHLQVRSLKLEHALGMQTHEAEKESLKRRCEHAEGENESLKRRCLHMEGENESFKRRCLHSEHQAASIINRLQDQLQQATSALRRRQRRTRLSALAVPRLYALPPLLQTFLTLRPPWRLC